MIETALLTLLGVSFLGLAVWGLRAANASEDTGREATHTKRIPARKRVV